MTNYALKEYAEELYVKDRMTQEEIAEKLHLNERTIRRWKKAHNWEFVRKDYWQKSITFHEELYIFTQKLMLSIKRDMENGVKIDRARISTAVKLMPMIKLVKKYEESVSKSKLENHKREILILYRQKL